MSDQRPGAKNYWVPLFVLALALMGGAIWWFARRSNYGPWIAPPEAKALVNPVPPSPAALASAMKIYLDRCARCHGDHGNGDGPDASMYKTPPGVLSDAGKMGQESDGEIFWKIGEGRRPMPGFAKELSDEQRWQLVDFIRSLAATAPSSAAKPQPESSPSKN